MSDIIRLDSFVSGNVGTFDAMGQGAVAMLESITAPEKAQSVPYVQIWEIDPATGLPVHANGSNPKYPLTAWSVSPPVFGMASDELAELRERPPVSLESIHIKTVNPMGLILYRQLEIEFIVHRPDLFSNPPDKERDNWSSLITPGSVFAMEYGWSANEQYVKNPVLNGNDIEGTSVEGRKWIVHGRKIIRFAVYNYRFVILPDQQIKVHVSALEDGDFGMRHTYVIKGVKPQLDPANPGKIVQYDADKLEAERNANIKKIQDEFKTKLEPVKIRNSSVGYVVRLEDVFNIFFADKVEESILDLGYSNVSFTIGCCNQRTPVPLEMHRWEKRGLNTPKNYIGDFTIPYQMVMDKMAQLIAHGTEMTVFNFITPFIRIISDPTVWQNLNSKNVTMPDVQLRFIPMRERDRAMSAHIFLVDVKTELMRFTEQDKEKYQQWAKEHSRSASNVANRDEIRKICLKKGIPYIETMKGNSWIQDAQFDIHQDELITAILINRYYGKDRFEGVGKTTSQIRSETNDYRKTLYSSAIKGQITCIGNHGMDVMGMYWLDFGVPQWSGPFRLTERQDIIDNTGWTTTVSFISEGTDPLGTQGRPDSDAQAAVTPPQ